MQKAVLILCFLMVKYHTASAQIFDYTSTCKQAYQSIFKLKITEGLKLLEKEKKENPSNYMPYFIENYADFLKLYVNDNNALYKATAPKVEARLSAC